MLTSFKVDNVEFVIYGGELYVVGKDAMTLVRIIRTQNGEYPGYVYGKSTSGLPPYMVLDAILHSGEHKTHLYARAYEHYLASLMLE